MIEVCIFSFLLNNNWLTEQVKSAYERELGKKKIWLNSAEGMTESWGVKPLKWYWVWYYSEKRFGYFLHAATECEGSWGSAGMVYLLSVLFPFEKNGFKV